MRLRIVAPLAAPHTPSPKQHASNARNARRYLRIFCQYPGRDSNSYSTLVLADFESAVSTDSTTRAVPSRAREVACLHPYSRTLQVTLIVEPNEVGGRSLREAVNRRRAALPVRHAPHKRRPLGVRFLSTAEKVTNLRNR